MLDGVQTDLFETSCGDICVVECVLEAIQDMAEIGVADRHIDADRERLEVEFIASKEDLAVRVPHQQSIHAGEGRRRVLQTSKVRDSRLCQTNELVHADYTIRQRHIV